MSRANLALACATKPRHIACPLDARNKTDMSESSASDTSRKKAGKPGLGPTPTVSNHYVPKWYQRRFLTPGETRFRYLDLRPDRIENAPGRKFRASLMRWGPDRCFARDHLYTIKLGPWMTDMIEHGFFKQIDDAGLPAVDFFAHYDLKSNCRKDLDGIMRFMDAERFRTPRGLDNFARVLKVSDRNALLLAMETIYQQNATMWAEGVWEIVSASNSPTKFLLTDNPVTFYNERAFPGSPFCSYPNDALLRWVGTRTIFPLGLDRCLILTHLEHTSNPWKNPISDRTNARSYQTGIFKAQDVQTQRELEEDEVKRINFILKKRADRYIAACDEEWLYPERSASVTLWSKLDHDWFLMPNLYELHLGGTILMGFNDGTSAGWDEYGRPREHPHFERGRRDEGVLHHRARLEWGARRLGKSIGIGEKLGRRRPAGWGGYMREEVEAYVAGRRANRRGRDDPRAPRPPHPASLGEGGRSGPQA